MSDNSNNDDGGGEGDNDTTTTTTTTTLNDETQQPRKKRIVKKKEIVGIQLEKEYIKEELRKFKVDQLKELLDKRKIFHTQSIQKEAIINLILEKQQQKARYQELSKPLREYHGDGQLCTTSLSNHQDISIGLGRVIRQESVDRHFTSSATNLLDEKTV